MAESRGSAGNPACSAGIRAGEERRRHSRLRHSFTVVLISGLLPVVAAAHTLVIQAERLEYAGSWQRGAGHMSTGSSASSRPMVGAIALPAAGKWHLWVRAKDFPKDRPGTRNFNVRLGNATSSMMFGKHGQAGNDGWAWEDGGAFDLGAGPLLIVVGERATAFARCDALVLTDDASFRPKGTTASLHLPAAPAVRVEIRELEKSRFTPEPVESTGAEVARLSAGGLTFSFHQAATAAGLAIVMQVTAGSQTFASPAESYRVLYRPPNQPPRLTANSPNPTWDATLAPMVDAVVGGASVRMPAGRPAAPWVSGTCFPLRPVRARQVDAETVDLDFTPLSIGKLSARWHLGAHDADARVELHFVASAAGHFSLGYHSSVASTVDALDFVLMPPMYNGKRLPNQAMLLSSVTTAPLSLVNRGGASLALVAEPGDLTTGWPSAHNSRYAFGLTNEDGQAQPMLYSPVLGQPGSSVNAQAAIDVHFRVVAQVGTWYEAYRHIALDVFKLKDYRQPVYASLSDAALNLYDLVKQGVGWDARAKGPWNIESRNTVTHSSPLTYLSLYLLTGDREIYDRYARPSLEYLLSRQSPHFAIASPHDSNYYRDEPLGGPARPFGATVLAAAETMTYGRTPAFGELSTTKGAARETGHFGHAQPFSDSLALWRLTGDDKWLKQAVSDAGTYIAKNLRKLPQVDLGPEPFINVSFVPDWEGLLHLYEATGEKRFLDASAEGARWLLTTLRIDPVPAGDRVIHPGGKYDHDRHVWYLGDVRYRLGEYKEDSFSTGGHIPLPPTPAPEQRVPAWQVWNTGLGLEQPSTCTRPGNEAAILMSVWAPNLLRLAALTGDDLFRTAARNATIGRFTNYPGYYVDGTTNLYQQPGYPVAGPDVTSLYYHHVPPFLAYVLDYLFTDAEVRSKGAIKFPSVRQNGYVWFDSRLFGHAPGTVNGHKAWPWLHRTAATVDNIAVDRVLAHGDGRFFVILMNQTGQRQQTKVHFDAAVLGRAFQDEAVTLDPFGLKVIEKEGVKIDVATHVTAPPSHLPLPVSPVIERKRAVGSNWEAVGMTIAVPPFAERDLYVYVAAPVTGCTAATLTYKVGSGPERQAIVNQSPCEFSVKLKAGDETITWRVEVTK